jgi:hypothetical protein
MSPRGRHAAGAEPVRRPIAWRVHPDDAARFAAEGQHCQVRRCRNAISVVSWRWWRSAEAGRVLVAEHFICGEHGQQFADRHHIEIEAAPGRRSLEPRPAAPRRAQRQDSTAEDPLPEP